MVFARYAQCVSPGKLKLGHVGAGRTGNVMARLPHPQHTLMLGVLLIPMVNALQLVVEAPRLVP